jgi:hypothetical protein
MTIEPLNLEDMTMDDRLSSYQEEDYDGKDKKGKNKISLWSKIFNPNKLKKPNQVAVVYLRNNGMAELKVVESKKGFFSINDKTYHDRRDCTYITGKERIPLCVIFESDMLPIGKKEWDDREIREKLSELQDHVLRGIRHAELVRLGEKESKINMKQIIVWGLILLVGGIIAFNYLPK